MSEGAGRDARHVRRVSEGVRGIPKAGAGAVHVLTLQYPSIIYMAHTHESNMVRAQRVHQARVSFRRRAIEHTSSRGN